MSCDQFGEPPTLSSLVRCAGRARVRSNPPCALLLSPPHHSLARGARARVAPARSSCWRGDGIIPRRKEADGRSELTLCGETRTCTIYLPEGGRILLLLLLSPRRARALAQYLAPPDRVTHPGSSMLWE